MPEAFSRLPTMGPRQAGLHIDPHELINLIANPA
jgi:hypothetical protein